MIKEKHSNNSYDIMCLYLYGSTSLQTPLRIRGFEKVYKIYYNVMGDPPWYSYRLFQWICDDQSDFSTEIKDLHIIKKFRRGGL